LVREDGGEEAEDGRFVGEDRLASQTSLFGASDPVSIEVLTLTDPSDGVPDRRLEVGADNDEF
jgi:hypothetical protein